MGVALGLGLLVGLQRERARPPVAGVRTFALITLLGAATAMLAGAFGGWVVAAGFVGVAAAMVVGNLFLIRREDEPPGITTEIAMLVMFAVGALCAAGPMAAAVVLGAATALLLHAKPMLHGVAARLGDKDFRAIMQFVLLALVILPVLPDRTFGPEPVNVLNPRHVWLVVVLVVGISLAGFLAYRFIGTRMGMVLGGVLGGLISSTATSVSFARRARQGPGFVLPAAAVIAMASAVVYVRVLTEIAVVAPGHWRALAPPIGVMLMLSALLALVLWTAARKSKADLPEQTNPTELGSALAFGVLYAVVLVGAAAAKKAFGDTGLYAVAALSGLTDMDAITLSASRMVQDGLTGAGTAWRAIVLGSMANLGFKLAVIGLLGGVRLGVVVAMAFGVMIAASGAMLAWWPG